MTDLAPLIRALRTKIATRRKANSRPWVKVVVDANDLELLLDAATPNDAAYEALMDIAGQAFHNVPKEYQDAAVAQVNLVLEALGRDERYIRVPR